MGTRNSLTGRPDGGRAGDCELCHISELGWKVLEGNVNELQGNVNELGGNVNELGGNGGGGNEFRCPGQVFVVKT